MKFICECGEKDERMFVYQGPYAGFVYKCITCKKLHTFKEKLEKENK